MPRLNAPDSARASRVAGPKSRPGDARSRRLGIIVTGNRNSTSRNDEKDKSEASWHLEGPENPMLLNTRRGNPNGLIEPSSSFEGNLEAATTRKAEIPGTLSLSPRDGTL